MKKFFILVVALQLVVEIGVGLFVILLPEKAAPQAAPSEWYLLINQGFIALTMAIATAMLWHQRHNPAVVGFATALFAIYHTMITLSGVFTATLGNNFSPFLIHLILASLFWILWAQRSRLEG